MRAQVDEQGRLVFPPEVAARLGLKPGAKVHIHQEHGHLHLRWPVTRLSKVYVEPTSRCNLSCRTCIRNVWDEPLGDMSDTTFARLMEDLKVFSPTPMVLFGGFGEPLAHPHIIEMVAQAKARGAWAELITNGTLLAEKVARGVIAAKLDVLWVSLDGVTAESYADVRLGAALPAVLANLEYFRTTRTVAHHPSPEIGIAFVAMKRNIADLPELLRLSRRLGATRFLVSNVLPHTPAMRDEVLYSRALSNGIYLPSPLLPDLRLPKMDADEMARPPLYEAVCGGWNMNFAGSHDGATNDVCPFIEGGSTAIHWDGSVSPCLPLLHSSTSYLHGMERFSRHFAVGNVNERHLSELWNAPEYVEFREKVQSFDFSPCSICDGCILSETNEEDCYGNSFPTCGGCLWAQGVIQCP